MAAEQEMLGLFAYPFVTNVILPFLLIFVVVYAILEKTELLGKERRFANLLVALVIGFLFIGVQSAVGFTLKIIPLVATLIMVLLCIYLLFGFIGIEKRAGIQIALGIIFGIAFIVIILWATGVLERIATTETNANAIGIITLIAVLGGAIAMVLATKPSPATAA